MAAERQLDVPPYQLCPLIPKVQPLSNLEHEFQGRRGTATRINTAQAFGELQKLAIEAVDAHEVARTGRNIYVGCEDGSLLRYTLEDNDDGVRVSRDCAHLQLSMSSCAIIYHFLFCCCVSYRS